MKANETKGWSAYILKFETNGESCATRPLSNTSKIHANLLNTDNYCDKGFSYQTVSIRFYYVSIDILDDRCVASCIVFVVACHKDWLRSCETRYTITFVWNTIHIYSTYDTQHKVLIRFSRVNTNTITVQSRARSKAFVDLTYIIDEEQKRNLCHRHTGCWWCKQFDKSMWP